MDDNFDKEIKEKLDGYEDPSFDEAAFADFTERLGAVGPVPWYDFTVAKYTAAALTPVFLALILFYSVPTGNRQNEVPLTKDRQKIDSLEKVIQKLKSKPTLTAINRSSEKQDTGLSTTTDNIKSFSKSKETNSKTLIDSQKMVSLGQVDDLPPDMYQALVKKGMVKNDNGTAYLIVPEDELLVANEHWNMITISAIYPTPSRRFEWHPVMQEKILAENKASATAGDEDKHQAGRRIGFSIAPHADLVASQFSKGRGLLTPRVGLLAEFALSNKLSVEVGVDYATTSIDFDRDFYSIKIPNLDTSLGTINSAHISNSVISTPLALRYQKPLSAKSNGFIRVAYTPYFSIVQEYQCSYSPSYYPKPNTYYGNSGVTSILRVKDHFLYGNTSSVSLGITRSTKGRDRIEGSVFYESSLSGMGNEKLSMSLYGARAAYWFRVK